MQTTSTQAIACGTEFRGDEDPVEIDGVTVVDRGDQSSGEGDRKSDDDGSKGNEGRNDGSKEEKEAEESSGQRP